MVCWDDLPNSSKLESAGKITHFSFAYEKVNKTDSFRPSGCDGPFIKKDEFLDLT